MTGRPAPTVLSWYTRGRASVSFASSIAENKSTEPEKAFLFGVTTLKPARRNEG